MKTFLRFLNSTGMILDSTRSRGAEKNKLPGTETLSCPLTFSVSLPLSYSLFPRKHSIKHTHTYTHQNGEGNDKKKCPVTFLQFSNEISIKNLYVIKLY